MVKHVVIILLLVAVAGLATEQTQPRWVHGMAETHHPRRLEATTTVSIVQGDETAFWDYQSWGSDDRHLWVTPEGHVHAVYFGCAGSKGEWAKRNSFYVFSDDNGTTLKEPVRVEDIDAEFPAMDILPDGRAVVASHNGRGHDFELFLSVDSAAGAGNFTRYPAPVTPSNYGKPVVAVLSDSLIVLGGNSVAGGEHVMNVFNVNTKEYLHAENQVIFPGIEGEGTFIVVSNKNGRAAFLLVNFYGFPLGNVEGENNVWMIETLDGGLTWGDPVMITHYSNEPDDVQELLGTHNLSALYLEDELHVVFAVMNVDVNDFASISRNSPLVHWCPTVNDGEPTVAVRWDSLHFGQLIDWSPFWYPHLGVDEAGVLTMVFSGLSTVPEDVDGTTGLPYTDIFAVSSGDNGLTWGEPKNLTRTPGVEETLPYISAWNPAGRINVLYQSDTVPGHYYYGGDMFFGEIDHILMQTDHPSTDPYDPITAVKTPDRAQPDEFTLRQNYPNPFNPSTVIEFSCCKQARISLHVYDIRGRHIKTLADGLRQAGRHSVRWHGDDDSGQGVPAGVYFVRLMADGMQRSIKVTLLK